MEIQALQLTAMEMQWSTSNALDLQIFIQMHWTSSGNCRDELVVLCHHWLDKIGHMSAGKEYWSVKLVPCVGQFESETPSFVCKDDFSLIPNSRLQLPEKVQWVWMKICNVIKSFSIWFIIWLQSSFCQLMVKISTSKIINIWRIPFKLGHFKCDTRHIHVLLVRVYPLIWTPLLLKVHKTKRLV